MSKTSRANHDRLQAQYHGRSEPTAKINLILADLGRLLFAYVAWKIFLGALIAASPGIGYDTSTDIYFLRQYQPYRQGVAHVLYDLAVRLTRWDGIYFTSNAHDGYVFEQQWAFSWLMARIISRVASVSFLPHSLPPLAIHALAGCVISFVTHLGAVVALYFLVITILPTQRERSRSIARTTAYLHIVSPAGVFLLAPYGEATFAMLNMVGMLCYTLAIHQRTASRATHETTLMLASGAVFGLATAIRNNGVLSGVIFAWDALSPAFNLVFGTRSLQNLRRLATTVLAGTLVALGFVLPQLIAYQEYCTAGDLDRPWCRRALPSIYTWVQDHYWEVGLFKYWTLSNLPLFILATPVLLLLLSTGYAAIHHARAVLIAVNGEERPALVRSTSYQADRLAYKHVLERLALPQIVLSLLAATSFHVQIINRISSGYPVWYMVLAIAIHDTSPMLECGHHRAAHYYPFRLLHGTVLEHTVQGCVVYAVIQAGLYSSFLPPA